MFAKGSILIFRMKLIIYSLLFANTVAPSISSPVPVWTVKRPNGGVFCKEIYEVVNGR